MPYYKFEINTHIAPEVILQKIASITSEPKSFRDSIRLVGRTPERPFEGRIQGNVFNLTRCIQYRNSFLPQVHGKVVAAHASSTVTVTMTLHPFVGIFMVFWVSMDGWIWWNMLNNARVSAPSSYGPAGMMIFAIVLMCAGFYPEASKARKLIESEIQ
jgi:hypothetical protein